MAKVVLLLQRDLVICKGHPGGTGFEGMKGSHKAAEAWHCERLWKAIGEGAASVAIDRPGLINHFIQNSSIPAVMANLDCQLD